MFQCYRGHSAHVTRVRFSHDHRFLLSIGGGDKALIQWRHDVEDLDSSDDDEPAAVPKRAGAQRKEGGVEAWELVQVHPDALRRTPLQVRGVCHQGEERKEERGAQR
jgi:microtubule-associated protein-like 6